MGLLSEFRRRRAEVMQGARRKAAAERANAERTLELDDLLSGFSRPSQCQDDNDGYKSALSDGFEWEDD